ncbi:hypothetical protein EG68_01619 [Paragonimus skrjabini miyazakii]|uniref:LRRNT domain-containing protein n=1 Tax=Paragonimus skrjabini miyazakii TaxID=59628 RepID=A0A8S9Z5G4_9TREM|nr:hypothetical protein EG68_01619 [Paragonimus skrjabini miyazakii]
MNHLFLHRMPLNWVSIFILGSVVFVSTICANKGGKQGDNQTKKFNKVWAVLPETIQTFSFAPNGASMINYPKEWDSKRPIVRREISRRSRFYLKQQQELKMPDSSVGFIMSRRSTPQVQLIQTVRNLCPSGCKCSYLEVDCRHGNFKEIPKNIPLNTERLTIIGSELRRLTVSSFDRLNNLKTLLLLNNRIETIESGAFSRLISLKRL